MRDCIKPTWLLCYTVRNCSGAACYQPGITKYRTLNDALFQMNVAITYAVATFVEDQLTFLNDPAARVRTECFLLQSHAICCCAAGTQKGGAQSPCRSLWWLQLVLHGSRIGQTIAHRTDKVPLTCSDKCPLPPACFKTLVRPS